KFEGNDELIKQIIDEGSKKAQIEAQKTLSEMLKVMGI
ncbi:MAG: hypothetical protein US46_C0008G0068, partial [Candidatus Shapirobacteria bacterium GW2011_GWF2_37_20]